MAAPALHGTAFGRGVVSAMALAFGQLVFEPAASARETATMGAVQVTASLPTASGCPSEHELLASVRHALRSEPDDKAPLAVEIVVEIAGDEAVGTVRTLPREAGAAYGERTTRAPSCANLSEVLVLIVSQTLDPLAGAPPPPSAAKKPPVAGPPVRWRPRAPIPPPARRVVFGAIGGLKLASGILPSLALGADFGIWAGLAPTERGAPRIRGSGRIELHATFFAPEDLALGPGVLHVRATEGSLALCPVGLGRETIALFPCLTAGVLAASAGAERLERNATTESLVPFVSLAGVARVKLTSSLAARLMLAGIWHLRQAEWEVAPIGRVHRVTPLAMSVSLSFESFGP